VTTRKIVPLEEGFEYEDGATPAEMMLALESTLLPLLEAEKQRLQDEVDFLKEVYAGITRGSAIENASTSFVDSFLVDLVNKLNT